MEIRELTPDEQEAGTYIGRQAFAHGDRGGTGWHADPNCPPLTSLGVFDEAGMQARLHIIHYRVHLGANVVVPMGGIGGVACLPASRGKGYTGKLLQAALARMRDLQMPISSLFPFSWDFYRRYGWEWVGLTRQYVVPTRILKPSPHTEHVRAATEADRPKIESCYTAFALRYRGLLARDEKRWNDHLKDREEKYTFTFVYENNGIVEGYLSYRGGTDQETRLNEFIALNPTARLALLGLLRRHDMQTDKFAWRAPGNDPLYHQLCHNDVETKLFPTTQGRVVDVAAAFAAWKPNADSRGSVRLAVTDEHADWNQGVWHIEYENGQTDIRKTEREPQVTLSIQSLSQAYYGTPTLDEVREAGQLQVHEETGFDTLRDLLSGPPMWTCDSF